MKIGILTLPLNTNYGGILQCYALCKILKENGHTPVCIDIDFNYKYPSIFLIILRFCKRFFFRIIGLKSNSLFLEYNEFKYKNKQLKYSIDFIIRHIPLTKFKYPSNKTWSLNNELCSFDAFIVGSDQVWNAHYAKPNIETYFLSFAEEINAKKIAYAASFGSDKVDYNYDQKKLCGNLIKKFNAVSVRESSAIPLVTQLNWECIPIQLLDPTMLLNKEDYILLAESVNITKQHKELFYYFLDITEDKQDLINKIQTIKGYKSFTTELSLNELKISQTIDTNSPIEKWLSAFRDAEFIVTDSFHGCVFSIIFNKPFIAFANKERGLARFNSLLSIFSLNNRLILESSAIDLNLLDNDINWKNINNILLSENKKAYDFIISNIN